MGVPEELRRLWVKNYLGPFYKKPSREVKELVKDVDVFGRYFIKTEDIDGAIAYCLLRQGRVNYRVLTSTQVIDIFLGRNEDVLSYKDLVDSVLLCLVSKYEMENKRRWELVFQLAYERTRNNLGFIIVSDTYGSIERELEKIGFTIIGNGRREIIEDNF